MGQSACACSTASTPPPRFIICPNVLERSTCCLAPTTTPPFIFVPAARSFFVQSSKKKKVSLGRIIGVGRVISVVVFTHILFLILQHIACNPRRGRCIQLWHRPNCDTFFTSGSVRQRSLQDIAVPPTIFLSLSLYSVALRDHVYSINRCSDDWFFAHSCCARL